MLIRCRPRSPELGSSPDPSPRLEFGLPPQTPSVHLHILSEGYPLPSSQASLTDGTQASLCRVGPRKCDRFPPTPLWFVPDPASFQRRTSNGCHSPYRRHLRLRLHAVHIPYSLNRDYEESLLSIPSSFDAGWPYQGVTYSEFGLRHGTEASFLGPARPLP